MEVSDVRSVVIAELGITICSRAEKQILQMLCRQAQHHRLADRPAHIDRPSEGQLPPVIMHLEHRWVGPFGTALGSETSLMCRHARNTKVLSGAGRLMVDAASSTG